jgi:acyl phosphate:glycerol-3-phosphate acyltransferase
MNEYQITAALSYLLGSIPFGYLLVRVFRGEDVRSSGSGNIGATNVARKSPALGVLTLLFDAGKGCAAVLLAKYLYGSTNQKLLLSTAALFAIVGHLFPVWLKFRGGKGVATGLGSFLIVAPKSILCAAAIFIVALVVFRFVSLGSVLAAISFPVFVWMLHEYSEPRTPALLALASVLIVWKHRDNLRRLATRTEPKIGSSREAET